MILKYFGLQIYLFRESIKGTYFDNFQSVAFENPTADRLENGTDADQTQSGIAAVALKETALRVFSLISVLIE